MENLSVRPPFSTVFLGFCSQGYFFFVRYGVVGNDSHFGSTFVEIS